MIQIRKNIFETNSSSVHSITICTEEDFQQTLNLVKTVNYKAQCFSFKYSPRPNTVASLSKDQIEDKISSNRLNRLQRLLEEQRIEFVQSLLNKEVYVLFDNNEMEDKLQISGRDEYMHLVVYNCKDLNEKNKLYGKLLKVKIINIGANILTCDIS